MPGDESADAGAPSLADVLERVRQGRSALCERVPASLSGLAELASAHDQLAECHNELLAAVNEKSAAVASVVKQMSNIHYEAMASQSEINISLMEMMQRLLDENRRLGERVFALEKRRG